jgi:hypothetical protein
VVKRVQNDFEEKPKISDPMMVAEGFMDPEDIIQDILLSMNATTAGAT